jgi:hypothetical protein
MSATTCAYAGTTLKSQNNTLLLCGRRPHAGYFQPGEYLTEIELPFLLPLVRITDEVMHLGRRANTTASVMARAPHSTFSHPRGLCP